MRLRQFRPTEDIHESWTSVAAPAASTSTMELGQLVMRVSLRRPALLAEMASPPTLQPPDRQVEHRRG
jgi:alkanesulfonate monooxygenase SsuD/methylene tetrahydromethanopterin reductase-like flavin-dependent oxidoreductase (luciferase family)